MTELPAQRVLLESLAVIDGERLAYFILGGFAVRVWGIPRPTYDVDIAVQATDEVLLALLQRFGQAGFTVPTEHAKGYQDTVAGMPKVHVTKFVSGTVWEVDLFVARGGLPVEAMRRRRKARIDGRDVWVASPEDLILLKLMAFRRKDQADIEDVLLVAGQLDVAYLRSWADKLGVRSRLEPFFQGP